MKYTAKQLDNALFALEEGKRIELVKKYGNTVMRLGEEVAASLLPSTSVSQAVSQLDQIVGSLVAGQEDPQMIAPLLDQELDNINVYIDALTSPEKGKKLEKQIESINNFFFRYGLEFQLVVPWMAYLDRPAILRLPVPVLGGKLKEIEQFLSDFDVSERKEAASSVSEHFWNLFSSFVNGNSEAMNLAYESLVDVLAESKMLDDMRDRLDLPLSLAATRQLIMDVQEVGIDNLFATVARHRALLKNSPLKDQKLAEFIAYLVQTETETHTLSASVVSLTHFAHVKMLQEQEKLNAEGETSMEELRSLIKELQKNPDDAKKLQSKLAALQAKIMDLQYALALGAARYLTSLRYLEGTSSPSKDVIEQLLSAENTSDFAKIAAVHALEVTDLILNLRNFDLHRTLANLGGTIAERQVTTRFLSGALATLMEQGMPRTIELPLIIKDQHNQLRDYTAAYHEFLPHITAEERWFSQLPYASLDEVPELERDAFATRILAYRELLGTFYTLQGRLSSISSTLEVLGAETPQVDYPAALRISHNFLSEISQFLGDENFEVQPPELVSVSEIHQGLMRSYFDEESDALDGAWGEQARLTDKLSRLTTSISLAFENGEYQPHVLEPHVLHFYERAISAFNQLADNIEGLKDRLMRLSSRMDELLIAFSEGVPAALQQSLEGSVQIPDDLFERYPHFKVALMQSLANAKARIADLLGQEMFSDDFILQLRSQANMFASARRETLDAEKAQLAIIAAASLVAVPAAALGGRLSSYLFGNSLSAGRFSVPTLVSEASQIVISSVFGAAGSTAGIRGGQYASDAIGWSRFAEKGMIDWSANALWNDFYKQALIMGGIGAFMRSLPVGMRERLSLFNPLSGFEKGVEALSAKTLVQVGLKTTVEFTQEVLQNALQYVHPWLGHAAAFLSGSNVDIDIPLERMGLNARDLGLTVENGRLTYTTDTPSQFLIRLQQYCVKRNMPPVEATLNPDGTIDIDAFTHNTLGLKGTLTIAPAMRTVPIVAQVQRIGGLRLDPLDGSLHVDTPLDLVAAKAALEANGYVLQNQPSGDLVAVKNNESVFIKGTEGGLEILQRIEQRVADIDTPFTVEELTTYATTDRAIFEGLVSSAIHFPLSFSDIKSIAAAQKAAGITIDSDLYLQFTLKSDAVNEITSPANLQKILRTLENQLPEHMKHLVDLLRNHPNFQPHTVSAALALLTLPGCFDGNPLEWNTLEQIIGIGAAATIIWIIRATFGTLRKIGGGIASVNSKIDDFFYDFLGGRPFFQRPRFLLDKLVRRDDDRAQVERSTSVVNDLMLTYRTGPFPLGTKLREDVGEKIKNIADNVTDALTRSGMMSASDAQHLLGGQSGEAGGYVAAIRGFTNPTGNVEPAGTYHELLAHLARVKDLYQRLEYALQNPETPGINQEDNQQAQPSTRQSEQLTPEQAQIPQNIRVAAEALLTELNQATGALTPSLFARLPWWQRKEGIRRARRLAEGIGLALLVWYMWPSDKEDEEIEGAKQEIVEEHKQELKKAHEDAVNLLKEDLHVEEHINKVEKLLKQREVAKDSEDPEAIQQAEEELLQHLRKNWESLPPEYWQHLLDE